MKLEPCHCEPHPEQTEETLSFPQTFCTLNYCELEVRTGYIMKHSLISTTLPSFAQDDSSIKEKRHQCEVEILNTAVVYPTNCHNVFPRSSPISTATKQKEAYMDKIAEKLVGERKINNSLNILKIQNSKTFIFPTSEGKLIEPANVHTSFL